MSYGVRSYGMRSYGDSARVITDASPYTGGGGGGTRNFAGTDTLTFTDTGKLTKSRRASDTLTFTDTGAFQKGKYFVSTLAASDPSAAVRFASYARLTLEAAIVTPPSSLVYVKRVSHTMPAPTLDSRGRPT